MKANQTIGSGLFLPELEKMRKFITAVLPPFGDDDHFQKKIPPILVELKTTLIFKMWSKRYKKYAAKKLIKWRRGGLTKLWNGLCKNSTGEDCLAVNLYKVPTRATAPIPTATTFQGIPEESAMCAESDKESANHAGLHRPYTWPCANGRSLTFATPGTKKSCATWN